MRGPRRCRVRGRNSAQFGRQCTESGSRACPHRNWDMVHRAKWAWYCSSQRNVDWHIRPVTAREKEISGGRSRSIQEGTTPARSFLFPDFLSDILSRFRETGSNEFRRVSKLTLSLPVKPISGRLSKGFPRCPGPVRGEFPSRLDCRPCFPSQERESSCENRQEE